MRQDVLVAIIIISGMLLLCIIVDIADYIDKR